MMAWLGEGGEKAAELGTEVRLIPKKLEGDKITLIALLLGEEQLEPDKVVVRKRGEPVLAGRVAIVTGAGRGIGRAIALRFAQEGANLVLTARTMSQLEECAKEAETKGVRAIPVSCDVSDPSAVNHMVEAALKQFGRIDILVNNAGISRSASLVKMTDEQWKSVLDINLGGTFYCMRAVAPIMARQRPRGGKIINFTSTAAKYGNVGQANYAASKWGIIALTKVAAREFANDRIQVNAVMPGYIETDMTADTPPAYKETILGQIPLARSGRPEDVADVVLFLASDQSSYMQGVVVQVDGGLRM
jgi:3-oxoacyl-(acyl-carrier-protein) reductase